LSPSPKSKEKDNLMRLEMMHRVFHNLKRSHFGLIIFWLLLLKL
jgi:hypothetical protein